MSTKDILKRGTNRVRRIFQKETYDPILLHVTKCQWMNDADAPVIFMIDDFTNAWFDKNANGKLDTGEDWGAGGRTESSAIAFLEKNLLHGFPEIKVTLFAVVGKMSAFRKECTFTGSGRMDEDEEALQKFRPIFFDDRYEIAYHGLNHGRPAKESERFCQEWLTFCSVRDAVKQIEEGKRIYQNAFGSLPEGGKYCGYRSNEYSDESIDQSGFNWWCRYWYPKDSYQEEECECFDLRFFGENRVVDIPSNVNGMHWKIKQVKKLIKLRKIIAIQEHISPYRVDHRIQTPNIVDDLKELRRLFKYLSKRNLWYTTCGEVANYFRANQLSTIYNVSSKGFAMEYSGKTKNTVLTLLIDSRCICSQEKPYIKIWLPNGCLLAGQQYRYDIPGYRHRVTVPVMNGMYLVEASMDPCEKLEAWVGDNNRIQYSRDRMAGAVEIRMDDRTFCYWNLNSDGTRRPAKRKANLKHSLFCWNSSERISIEVLRDGTY